MMNLVLLPATDPDDPRYGTMPERIAGYPGVVLGHVRFPHVVWYNQAVREQALQQINALPLSPIVLVGFSKSGLGAWNIARTLPGRVEATIIFDAPVIRAELPPWGTGPFYADNEAWLADLPIRHVAEFKAALPAQHRLILISGANFHSEMMALSQALNDTGVEHTFLPRPHLKHHWSSGWIEEGLDRLLPAANCR
jgi:pimeloyl-ACP methyl ester carboxylesterase